jgi:hypothetical protein
MHRSAADKGSTRHGSEDSGGGIMATGCEGLQWVPAERSGRTCTLGRFHTISVAKVAKDDGEDVRWQAEQC